MNVAEHTAPEYDEALLDAYTREMYHQRSCSPRDMTDERWERVKQMFPGSVRQCREDVLRFHADELRVTYDQYEAEEEDVDTVTIHGREFPMTPAEIRAYSDDADRRVTPSTPTEEANRG